MRRSLLLTIFALFLTKFTYSQEIILDFNGMYISSGEEAILDRVIIENLNNGESIEIDSAPFSINLNSTLGVNSLNTVTHKGFNKLYPNPFNTALNIEFFTEGKGTTSLNVYNLLGQKVNSVSKDFNSGIQTFTFRPNSDGLFFVVLTDNNNTYTAKVISNNTSSKDASLEYIGSEKFKKTKYDSTNARMDFYQVGDVLRMTGESGSLVDVIYDSPQANTTYTFLFDGFYRFQSHFIDDNIPSFVDIMFSVTDESNGGVDYLSADDFTVLEDGNPVSPSETFRCLRKLDEVPYEQKIVLMLDNSASLADELQQIQAAATTLVNQILTNPVIENQQIALYSFSSNPILLQDFTDDITALENAINTIELGFPSTNLYGSLIQGLNSFNNSYNLELIEDGYLIALTDGADTQGTSTLPQVLTARGEKRVFMIGLGNEIDPIALNDIDNTGSAFNEISDVNELEDTFEQITLDIIQYANSFYWLNYMSPKRAGSHTLTIEIPGNTNLGPDNVLTSSFFAGDFVDVLSGVYANIDTENIYGIDEIIFDYQGEPLDPFALEAVTYWANNCPEFEWSIADTSIATVTVDTEDNSKAIVTAQTTVASQTILTITDTENNYTKDILITITDQLPVINLLSISPIIFDNNSNGPSSYGASAEVEVIEEGDSEILNKGICVSKFPSPTVINDVGIFNVDSDSGFVRELNSNSIYYARAWARNDYGISYSNEIEFTTSSGRPLVGNTRFLDYTTSTAQLKGDILDDGGFPLIEKGFCWSANTIPTTADSKIIVDGNDFEMEALIENLDPNTLYLVRAYAINSEGTTYDTSNGSQALFKTRSGIPNLISTYDASSVNVISALIGGIAYENGSVIDDKGVCYNTQPNPTINDNVMSSGNGNGEFYLQLNNLNPSSMYYVRTYTNTPQGTFYGNEVTFTTLNTLEQFNMDITSVRPNQSVAYGYLGNDGGAVATQKGFVWSTSPNPTTNNNLSDNGANLGLFSETINGLQENTTYYIRPYYINQNGTFYGEEQSFTTTSTTYEGYITLDTQEDVNEFGLSGVTNVIGGISITTNNNPPNNVVDLSPLNNIVTISDHLSISELGTFNFDYMDAFNNLTSVNRITFNNIALSLINGFNSLTSVNIGGDINLGGIRFNESLATIRGFNNLTTINGSLEFYNNTKRTLSGFASLTNIENSLSVSFCHNLRKIDAFNNLNQVDALIILNNDNLKTLDNFANISQVNNNILLSTLNSVDEFCFIQPLLLSGNYDHFGSYDTFGNPIESITVNDIPTFLNADHVLNFNCD